jgi:hypothetical protein
MPSTWGPAMKPFEPKPPPRNGLRIWMFSALGEVDRSLVGIKISSTHEGDLVAAHDETRLATHFD